MKKGGGEKRREGCIKAEESAIPCSLRPGSFYARRPLLRPGWPERRTGISVALPSGIPRVPLSRVFPFLAERILQKCSLGRVCTHLISTRQKMAKNPTVPWLVAPSLFLFLTHGIQCFFLPSATHLERILNQYQDGQPHSRGKRSISRDDRDEILTLHNKLRGEVYPSASNMEYMRWDEELERSAESWAQQCIWDHGPASLLLSIGQNLAVHWGRHRSPGYHVQSWYDEVKDYTYPYPHECNPRCPDRCRGPVCTHYTQMVWATTKNMGCAINVCKRMVVWGEVWENAVYLVCNYSPK